MTRFIIALIVLAMAVPLTHAIAQTQNQSKTGTGGVLETMDRIGTEYEKIWAGEPGRISKGTLATYGLIRALGAAKEAATFEGAINRNGESTPGSVDSSSTPSTATGTTSATSTN